MTRINVGGISPANRAYWLDSIGYWKRYLLDQANVEQRVSYGRGLAGAHEGLRRALRCDAKYGRDWNV